MTITIREIDVIGFLGLDKILGPGEIDELLEALNKEIWFRILHQQLPKAISQKEFKQLIRKYQLSSDFDSVIFEINKRWPKFNFKVILDQTTLQVKREFILNYLTKLARDYSNNHILQKLITKIKTELDKTEFSHKIINNYQNELYRLAVSASSVSDTLRIKPI